MGCVTSQTITRDDFHQRYSLGKKLGEGSFGQVRETWNDECSQPRAVKIIDAYNENSEVRQSLSRHARQEELIWKKIGRHDHCVRLMEGFADQRLYYFVMERCTLSLIEGLQATGETNEFEVATIFKQMLLGVSHLHSKKIVHRDIKPQNFLFGGQDGRIIKLCDFGMAAEMPKFRGGTLSGCYGTPPYMSPEMAGNQGHTLSTDVWSLGATAYVLLFGDFPYMPSKVTAKGMKLAIVVGLPDPSFSRSSLELPPPHDLAISFVQRLLDRCPGRRVEARAALQLPFLVAKEEDLCPKQIMIKTKVMKLVEKNNDKLRTHVDPTVRRGLDELLERLQEQGRCLALHRYFSDPGGKEDPIEEVEVCRKSSRSSTHSGVVSTHNSFNGAVSNVSTTVSKLSYGTQL
mmetsp:Transcript_23574/g.42590  ORF Transcript_23574/g.42590 Transcript_23574/m.42590 type:complete len:403 (+) Transcript_23574:110-1318(+)